MWVGEGLGEEVVYTVEGEAALAGAVPKAGDVEGLSKEAWDVDGSAEGVSAFGGCERWYEGVGDAECEG